MSHPERRELATEPKFCEMEQSEMEQNQGANLFATQGSLNGFCCAAEAKDTFPVSIYWSSFLDPTSGYALVVLGRIGTPSPKLRRASLAQDDTQNHS